jgi:oxygen-independent coproporphyrinogen-3 oxidase
MELSPTHISLYGLKIEEGTHFFKHKDELTLPDEDAEYEMYTSSVKKLLGCGFERYEISNFAKDGYFSRHNLKYWQREDYLGMGVSAHSCIGNLRFFESDNMENYSEKHREITCETISEHDILCEKIMLGMRLGRGVDFNELAQIHGKKALEYRNALKKFEKDGYVYENQGSLSFTDKGMYISNYILSEILDFEE